VRKYGSLAREIVARGHEVAAHGWMHERWSELAPVVERDLIAKATAAHSEMLGSRHAVGAHRLDSRRSRRLPCSMRRVTAMTVPSVMRTYPTGRGLAGIAPKKSWSCHGHGHSTMPRSRGRLTKRKLKYAKRGNSTTRSRVSLAPQGFSSPIFTVVLRDAVPNRRSDEE